MVFRVSQVWVIILFFFGISLFLFVCLLVCTSWSICVIILVGQPIFTTMLAKIYVAFLSLHLAVMGWSHNTLNLLSLGRELNMVPGRFQTYLGHSNWLDKNRKFIVTLTISNYDWCLVGCDVIESTRKNAKERRRYGARLPWNRDFCFLISTSFRLADDGLCLCFLFVPIT